MPTNLHYMKFERPIGYATITNGPIIAYYYEDSTLYDPVYIVDKDFNIMHILNDMHDQDLPIVYKKKPHREYMTNLIFTDDGTQLLVHNINCLYMYNTKTGELISKWYNDSDSHALSISHDNEKVISVCTNLINVYEAVSGKLLFNYKHKQHPRLGDPYVESTSFSPDNSMILSCATMSPIEIHSSINGELLYTIDNSDNSGASISVDNKFIIFRDSPLNIPATEDRYKNVYMFDIEKNKLVKHIKMNDYLHRIDYVNFFGDYIYCQGSILKDGKYYSVLYSISIETFEIKLINYSNSYSITEYTKDYNYVFGLGNNEIYYWSQLELASKCKQPYIL